MSISSVDIASLGIDVDDLINKVDDENFEEYLQEVLVDKSPEEAGKILEAIREELTDAVKDYEDMLEGAEEDEDRAEDRDDDIGEDRAKAEQDELEDIIDFLEDDVLDDQIGALKDAEEEYRRLNMASGDDMLVSTLDYEDGEEVNIQATSGLADVFDDEEEVWEEQDIDGDSQITYRDYELWKADKDLEAINSEEIQDIYLQLQAGDEVIKTDYSGSQVTFTIKNRETGKTVQFNVSGIANGVNVYLDGVEEGYIKPSLYKSWDDDLQKIMYFGNEGQSVYNHLNEVSDQEKLGFIKGYQEVVDEIEKSAQYYAASSSQQVQDLANQYIDQLFEYYNSGPGEADPTAIWGDIINDMDSLSAQMKSDVLITMVMAIARGSDGDRFFQLVAGAVGRIEKAFLEDSETFSAEEAPIVIFLEMQSGGMGMFGGAEMFNAESGLVFKASADSGYNLWASEFIDEETMKGYIESYQDLLMDVSWALDSGADNAVIEGLETNIETETADETQVFDQSDWDALNKAYNKIHDEGGKHASDGLSHTEFETGVKAGITALIAHMNSQLVNVGDSSEYGTPATLAAALKSYLTGDNIKNKMDGDFAAGIVYALGQACPDILSAMLHADPTLGQFLTDMINGETVSDRDIHKTARSYISLYSMTKEQREAYEEAFKAGLGL